MVLVYALANMLVSYKYEIDEARMWRTKIDISIAADYLKNTIMLLAAFVCYLLINIFYLSFHK